MQMIDSGTLIQLLAMTMALFIGLLPVTYMSWRDRLIESARREAGFMGGIVQWMFSTDNNIIRFHGPFRYFNIHYEVDINQPPASITEIDNQLRGISESTRVEQIGLLNPDSAILDGLNHIIGSTLKRGYAYFIALLVIDSTILSCSVLLASVDLNLPFAFPISLNQLMMFGLFFGLISYILYAATMFTDRQLRWDVPPRLRKDGTATVAMLSSLWRHQ